MDFSYEIFSDSSSNLTDELVDKLKVNIVSLVYIVDGEEHISYIKGRNNDDFLKNFYSLLRERKEVSTSCINTATFVDAFEEKLKQGKDILYIGFSSALSGTYQSGEDAMVELRKKYPERKLISVNTLGASLGEGLLLYYAANMRLSGESIEKTAQWVEDNKLHLAHWFTVDDLFFLFRGGRVKKTAYMLATVAHIKPLMHMDNEGRLTPVSKVIGRKKSIMALADKVVASIVNPEDQYIFISHGDCMEDVDLLIKRVSEKITCKGFVVNHVDPVVGAHSGPGTVAIFCLATER